MTAPAPLDAAVREAVDALAVYARTPRGSVLVHEDALARLVAVAKAAVEMRDRFAAVMDDEYGKEASEVDSIAAFDRAAGEGR